MSRSDFKSFGQRDCAFRNSKGKEKSAPALPPAARFADVHCHLGMLADAPLALARAAHFGFGLLVCVVDPGEAALGPDEPTAAQTFDALDLWQGRARELLAEWGEQGTALSRVRFAVGVHPHNAKNFDAAQGELLRLLKDPRACCVGEIGLDYHYDLSPREVQREVFAQQLRLAQEVGMPVELHLREAHADAVDILRREGVPQEGCVVHCFNLDRQVLAPFLEMGCHISFGGPLTFRKAFYTRRACLDVPIDRLLTETDAPYMAPEPLRGTVCEPAQTLYTLRTMLDCFGYAGTDAAQAAVSPRQADIDAGIAQADAALPDFAALQQGLDEAAFCAQVYGNAASLLDRAPVPWQVS